MYRSCERKKMIRILFDSCTAMATCFALSSKLWLHSCFLSPAVLVALCSRYGSFCDPLSSRTHLLPGNLATPTSCSYVTTPPCGIITALKGAFFFFLFSFFSGADHKGESSCSAMDTKKFMIAFSMIFFQFSNFHFYILQK